nr:hypothetical protein [uncultured Acetatifactor sp.]
MTVLLEMKERIKLIYSKYEAFIVPVLKFLLAFITFSTLNSRMGYMTRIDDMRIMLIAALTCSFLPVGLMVLMAAVFSLMHMYALSMEVALVGLCMYLIMYLLFFRFSPKDSLVVVLTPLLFSMKIPYVVPIAVGLLCGPASIVSVGCGIAVFYLLRMVIDSAPNIRIMEEGEILEKVRFMVEGILGNKAMLVMIAAFVVTVLVVYLIRRMSVDYSWTIAMVTGAMINVVLLLIGDLLYDVNLSMGSVLLGSLLALVVAKVIEFFRFCVDYSRTEKVQFEDDEYYYYVKAVPKMTVSVPTKTVKRINSQRDRIAESEPRSRNPRQPKRDVERMASRRGDARTGAQYRNGGARSGRVAVGNVESQEELDIDVEDYEEWP